MFIDVNCCSLNVWQVADCLSRMLLGHHATMLRLLQLYRPYQLASFQIFCAHHFSASVSFTTVGL